MTTSKNRTIPITLGLLAVVAVVLLATLVVPVLVGVGKVMLIVCLVLLLAFGTGLFGFAARRR